MRQKIVIILLLILTAGSAVAQQKKPAATKPKPKPKAKTSTTVKKAAAPAVEDKAPVCYPLKPVKDYYKIDIRDEQFKGDFEEIFELSPYDYSGYALKTIIENTIRMRLGEAAANSLDLFAGASYLEIGFMNSTYKSQIISELCGLFADHDAFEKHINKLKKESRAPEAQWRM